MNAWIQDAINAGWWDLPKTLKEYRDICQESLDIEKQNKTPENADRRIGLIDAIHMIDARIAELASGSGKVKIEFVASLNDGTLLFLKECGTTRKIRELADQVLIARRQLNAASVELATLMLEE